MEKELTFPLQRRTIRLQKVWLVITIIAATVLTVVFCADMHIVANTICASGALALALTGAWVGFGRSWRAPFYVLPIVVGSGLYLLSYLAWGQYGLVGALVAVGMVMVAIVIAVAVSASVPVGPFLNRRGWNWAVFQASATIVTLVLLSVVFSGLRS
ncbi:MAG: hypothetical protein NTY61_03550 [Candidatus Parcubacteria bacterium]|nr:hypothetical protein [Candidatus Parcubacteria bacterium]